MAEERTPSRRRGRIGRELTRIQTLPPEIAAWDLHLARRALLAALEVRATEWRKWSMFRHDPRFRPAGMGFPVGSFFLSGVLFADGAPGAAAYGFDLRLPLPATSLEDLYDDTSGE